MKKTLLVLLFITALLLTACGGAAEPTEAPEAPEAPAATEAPVVEEEEVEEVEEMAPVELRFSYYADGVEADVMQPLLDAFMAENPDITVVLDVVPYAYH